MPFIPDFKPVQGNKQDAAPSIGTAMAPGIAVQRLGNSISQVGDDAGAYAMKLTEARDAGVESSAALSMQQAFNEHQEFRAQNPDESLWEEDIQTRVSAARETIMAQKMSPFMKAKLEGTLSSWTQKTVHSTRMDGITQARQRSRQAITNAKEAYKQAGDFASARKVVEEARGKVYLPEETDADLLDLEAEEKTYNQRQAYTADLAEIEQDPFTARSKYESATPPEGADPIEYAKKRDHWRSTLAREQNSIVDSIRDGIASGQITRPDQLDEYEDELGAATLATLKTGMSRITDETRKQEIAKPESQAAIIGSVSSAIESLDPKDIESRVRIESQLDDIQPGPTKNHLSGELTKKLSGEPPSPGPMRRVRSMLNDAYSRGYFGNVASTTPQTTADAIDDGFVQDGAKLQSLGFSQDQISKIQNPELKPAQQLDQFRQLWASRDTAKENAADPYTRAAAEAIVTRRNQITPPAEQRNREMQESLKALRRKGEIEKGLLEWQQDHPDGDIEAELMRRLGDAESSTFLDSLEGGSWFAPDDTGTTTNPDMPDGLGMASDSLLPTK